MKHCIFLVSIIMIFGCSKTPNDVLIDSYRDVEINVDMNQAINDGLFDVNIDVLTLFLDSVDEYVMNDENGDQIFSVSISNLIFGKTYEYQYVVNETFEILEQDRAFTVFDVENSVSDYYGELNPTLLILLVNMSYQIELGSFDPDIHFLDVAGTFNVWDGTNYHLVELESNLYTITITNLDADDEIKFKFRIDGDWNNAEFPDGGDNRSYIVKQGEQILELWYNDESGN